MLPFKFVILVVALSSCATCEESKWVWNKDNAETSKERALINFNDRPGRYDDHAARYEIYETVDDVGPLYGGPQRPPFINNHPASRPPTGLYGTGHHYGQGAPGDGVLTGPVPSWIRGPPFRQFDTCKCTARFNCKSPGISYGHCDVGKQHCCYNRDGGIDAGPPPSRPHHSAANGVLVGPGGPFDGPHHHQYRPSSPSHGPAVLVGPGGPTGIIGRPPHRPHGYGESNGVLIGPGGGGIGGGIGGFGYGRSKAN